MGLSRVSVYKVLNLTISKSYNFHISMFPSNPFIFPISSISSISLNSQIRVGKSRNLLYKVRLNFDGESSIVVKVKEGDNLYSKAAEIVEQHGLDRGMVMKISELLAKPSFHEQ